MKIFNKEREEDFENLSKKEETKGKMNDFIKLFYSLALMHSII